MSNMAQTEVHASEIKTAQSPLKESSTCNGNSQEVQTPDNLYHIMITQSHLNKDVNSAVEKVRVCGTYTSLPAAKAAAHRCLFDAGYEQEWFSEFDAKLDGASASKRRANGVVVYAVAPDKTTFTVSIATTPNVLGYEANRNGKVMLDLYFVLQTTVDYSRDEDGEERETNVEGCFESYEDAWKYAQEVLLCESDGVTKASFADYHAAAVGERDCGYGENVIVQAVGQSGVNFLVSVVKAQEMEAVRLAEAAMRIR
jgi:hypothetical protein